LRQSVFSCVVDAVEPLLRGIFTTVRIAGGTFGVFEDELLVSLEDVSGIVGLVKG